MKFDPSTLPFSVPETVRTLGLLSSALGWAIAGVCILFWLAMLVDCLRRPAFYPVLGTSWRTRLFWLATFLFLNPLMTLVYLLFGRLLPPKPRAIWPARVGIIGIVLLLAAHQLWPSTALLPIPLQFTRDPATGEMKLETGGLMPATAKLNATATETKFSQTMTGISGGSDESLFPCEHMVVLGASEHPLMQKVAGLLCEKLGSLPPVKSVTYYPPGELPPTGGRFPDMTLVLDLTKFNEADLQGYREMTCTIEVLAGQIPWPASHHFQSGELPPIFATSRELKLELTSRMAGVEAGAARYHSVANGVVEQIEKGILKELRERIARHRGTSHLPPNFYGQYRLPEASFFAVRPGWQTILSGTDIFTHNRTLWRFTDDRTTTEVFIELENELKSHGFKTETHAKLPDQPYLRMSKGEQVFEAYPPRPEPYPIKEGPPARPGSYVAVYFLRFTDAERFAAIEDLISSATTAEQLVPFRYNAHGCNGGVSDRLLERVSELPISSAQGFLAAAEWHHRRGKLDEARANLRAAVALAWADGDKSKIKSEAESLGKKLDLPNVDELQPSAEDLARIGIPQLSSDPSDGQPYEGEIAVGDSLRAWYLGRSGELCMTRCAVLPGEKEDQPVQLSLRVGSDGGHMTSSVGILPTTSAGKTSYLGSNSLGYNGVRIGAQAASDDCRRFKVSIKRLEDMSVASRPTAASVSRITPHPHAEARPRSPDRRLPARPASRPQSSPVHR